MITVNLTNEQFVAVERLVAAARKTEDGKSRSTAWPGCAHHAANVKLLDGIDNSLLAARNQRVNDVRVAAEVMQSLARIGMDAP